GYGLVRLDVIDTHDEVFSHELGSNAHSSRLIITLLSDLILRNSQGQYMTTVDAFLESVHKLTNGKFHLNSINAFLATTVHGGFNREWGLPIPQVPALKMGSVIELETPDNHDEMLAALSDLAVQGIGERLNEGFGRFAVNWQPFSELT